MKIRKKFTVAALLLSFLLMFASCTRSEMIDYSELNRRLKSENKIYAFSEENVFYGTAVYFARYSLISPEDMLLAMCENDRGQLYKVALNACSGENNEETKAIFADFVRVVIKSFVPRKNADGLLTDFGTMTDLLFTDCIKKAENGRYTLWLTSNSVGISVIIERQ